jgi:hypothetical protein
MVEACVLPLCLINARVSAISLPKLPPTLPPFSSTLLLSSKWNPDKEEWVRPLEAEGYQGRLAKMRERPCTVAPCMETPEKIELLSWGSGYVHREAIDNR